MRILALNNRKDGAAYTFIKGSKKDGYLVECSFLADNDIERLKALCDYLRPDEIILQLPSTGLNVRTQRAMQQTFGGHIAAAFTLGIYPVIKNLIKTRKSFGFRRREEAREFFKSLLDPYDMCQTSRRGEMQLLNTLALAHDSVESAEHNMS